MVPRNRERTNPLPCATGDATDVASPILAARLTSGIRRPGTTPMTMHGSTSSAMASFIDGATSSALAAPSERGWPRKPIPKAFTKATAVSPPVRASATTPRSMMMSVGVLRSTKPCSRPWSSSHSLENPLKVGTAMIEQADAAKSAAVTGIAWMSPPS